MNNMRVSKHNESRIWLFAMFAILIFLVTLFGDWQKTAASPTAATTITIANTVKQPDVKNLGINLGFHSRFGASQIMKNRILNPGFEPGEYAMIFPVESSGTAVTLSDGTSGMAIKADPTFWGSAFNQPEDFWNGAYFEIIDGVDNGTSGTIADFVTEFDVNTGDPIQYTFKLDQIVNVGAGDAVIVRKDIASSYEIPNHAPSVACNSTITAAPTAVSSFNFDTTEKNSGLQSVKISPSADPVWKYAMDSYHRDGDCTAGKLLAANGDWYFEFYAKADKSHNPPTTNSPIFVVLERNGGGGPAVTVSTPGACNFTLTDSWQKYSCSFTATSDPPTIDPTTETIQHVLELKIGTWGATEDIWIDDVQLYRQSQVNPTEFNDAIVDRLKELQPGILRSWGKQLGASLQTILATPELRKSSGYVPFGSRATDYQYSLHEFLELAEEIGSEPWYVVPPTFTTQEWIDLAEYLGGTADGSTPYADLRAAQGQTAPWTTVFDTIHLEFGNEMWNGTFNGAKLTDQGQIGRVANGRFAQFKSSPHFAAADFNLVIGGQHRAPGGSEAIENSSTQHNTLAIAPYFNDEAPTNFATAAEMYYPLFADSLEEISANGVISTGGGSDGIGDVYETVDILNSSTRPAIYEINFHTNNSNDGSPMSLKERNDFVTSLGGGLALPLHMLTYQKELGVIDQAAFTALQYSVKMVNGEYVRLWGLLRDLEGTGNKRPTWLGMELANKGIRGDLITTTHSTNEPTVLVPVSNNIQKKISDMPLIRSFAYRDGSNYGLVLFNLDVANTQDVEIKLPGAWADSSATIHTLTSADIDDDNEESADIALTTTTTNNFDENYSMTLAKHSMYVIEFSKTLSAPTVVAPSCNSATTNTMPTFDWSDVTNATNYQFLLVDTANSATPIVNTFGTPLAVSAYTPTTPLVDSIYQWRTRGQDSSGTWGPWMTSCHLAVGTVTVDNTTVSPCNATLTDNTPTLDWGDVISATNYEYEVQLNSVTVATDQSTTSSTTLASQLANDDYEWRVRVENSLGWGAWSSVCPFTVDAPTPGIPILLSPVCGSVTDDATPTLDWANVTNATNYQVLFFDAANPTPPIVNTNGTTVANSTYTVTTAQPDGNYRWRVRAGNGPGNWGAWSVSCDLQIGFHEIYLPIIFK